MNGTGLTKRSVAGSGLGRGGRIMGVEASVHNKVATVRCLRKLTERGLRRMGGWMAEEWMPSLRIRLSRDEGKVKGVTGRMGAVVLE